MVILALGSNLPSSYGDRFYNIDLALSYLEHYGIKIIKKSSYYETESYPDKKNPKFINIVILTETNLSPEDLASVLIFIEEKIERKRIKKNDPRTCDIDIIDYKNMVIDFNYNNFKFSVPHKKLKYRNFVLMPLKEILPAWIHPESKENIDCLVQKLPDEDRKSILKAKNN
tara:strand:- start:480 stop:992 length:513 start_codon:yes stop_codon:yes gene_type:complete